MIDKKNLHFAYDAMGNRILKTEIHKNPTTNNDKYVTTYYMRDPQGNVLAVYEHQRGETGDGTFTLTEQHLYGASRLGMKKRNLALSGSAVNESTPPVALYELTNHLSNVLAVITDEDNGSSNEPKVENLTDYYPFGMEMGGRNYSADEYRYGFNGKENDKDGNFIDFGARLYNAKIGRFLSLDPFVSKTMQSYGFAGNRPLMCVDFDGCVEITYNANVTDAQKMLFETIVNNAYLIIQNCDDAQRVIMEQTQAEGQHDIAKIYDDLKKGGKVKLDVQPYADNSNQLGYGNKEGIHIASELLPQLEEVYKSNNELYQALSFGVAVLVIHEYVHHKDCVLNEDITCAFTTAVEGKQNTNSIYGHRSMDVTAVIFGVIEYALAYLYKEGDGITEIDYGEPSLGVGGTMDYGPVKKLFEAYKNKVRFNKSHGRQEQSYKISTYVDDEKSHQKVYDLIGKYMEKVVPNLNPKGGEK